MNKTYAYVIKRDDGLYYQGEDWGCYSWYEYIDAANFMSKEYAKTVIDYENFKNCKIQKVQISEVEDD